MHMAELIVRTTEKGAEEEKKVTLERMAINNGEISVVVGDRKSGLIVSYGGHDAINFTAKMLHVYYTKTNFVWFDLYAEVYAGKVSVPKEWAKDWDDEEELKEFPYTSLRGVTYNLTRKDGVYIFSEESQNSRRKVEVEFPERVNLEEVIEGDHRGLNRVFNIDLRVNGY